MKLLKVTISISNQTRFNRFEWLKEPYAHFPEEELTDYRTELGVSASDISKKAGMPFPGISVFLKTISVTNISTSTERKSGHFIKGMNSQFEIRLVQKRKTEIYLINELGNYLNNEKQK